MKFLFQFLLLISIFLTFSSVAFAADSANNHYIEEIVVITTTLHKTQAETAIPISVISSQQLDETLASTLGETLKDAVGIANASFGSGIGQPVIRGQQGPRVSVLSNGTSVADASTFSPDHFISSEPIFAERIEVLRGPSTLLYGGGAIGGVVNIVDNRILKTRPEHSLVGLDYRYSSVNNQNLLAGKINHAFGDTTLNVNGYIRSNDNLDIPGRALTDIDEESSVGIIENTDSDAYSFSIGTSRILDSGYIGLSYNRIENEYGIPPGAHGHEEEEEEHEEEEEIVRIDAVQDRVDIRAELNWEDNFVKDLRFALTYNDYQHDELEGPEIGTTYSNESIEGRLELTHQRLGQWHGAFGLQYSDSDFSALGEEAYTPPTQTQQLGLFWIEDYHYSDAILFEFGLRYDYDSVSPNNISIEESFNSFSGSVSALWNLNTQWQLALALSSSERAPATQELFSNLGNEVGDFVVHIATDAIEVGNVNLDTEQTTSFDFSISSSHDYYDGFITFYYNDFDDYIFLQNSGTLQNDEVIFNYVQNDAEFLGVEYEVNIDIVEQDNQSFSATLFGDAIRGRLSNGDDVPRLPPFRIGTKFEYQRNKMNAYVSVLHAAQQNKPGALEESTDSYTKWDAGVFYKFTAFNSNDARAYLKVNNITDEEIRSSVSFLRDIAPEAGRSVELGLRLNF